MKKKQNTKKRPRKQTVKKQSGIARRGLSGSFQIIGISFLFGCGLFAIVSALEQVSTSSVFRVERIKWVGLQHLKEDEMLKRHRAVVGKNLFELDIEALHHRLLSNPRIKSATVKKDFPNRLLIIVEEKKPAAAKFETDEGPEKRLKQGGTVVVIDSAGAILQTVAATQNLSFLPTGIPRLVNFKKGSLAKALALGAILKNRQDVFIDLSNPDDLLVHFVGNTQERVGLLHFGSAQFEERWTRFLAIEDDLGARGLMQWEIDLRFPGQAVVKNGMLQGSQMSEEWSGSNYF